MLAIAGFVWLGMPVSRSLSTESGMRASLSKAGRLLRTVRYLRPGQISDRVARRLRAAPKVGGPVPPLRAAAAGWSPCAGRAPSLVGPSRFRFLAREAALDELAGWNDVSMPKLWLYNLHYFDDLLADGAAERQAWHLALIDRWIDDNPPLAGNGWEPYTLSRRIVNWIAAALAGLPLDEKARESLARQTRALAGLLEFHLLGNHLFANAKALIFAGVCFSGAEAERWLNAGLAIMARELDEQVLADGGHFELSPMYHALILEDVIDLVQLAAIYPAALGRAAADQDWAGRAARMIDWLAAMSHPDGEIAFFNDAAFGQARTLAQLCAYAGRAGIAAQPSPPPIAHLADSGYVRLREGPWCVFFDAAPVGPDYIPGHAHADTLSLEISLAGARLVTNTGTSTYAPGPEREAERATSAHATVEIDGANSSEVWASFRVGRRARPASVTTKTAGSALHASGAHDGYRFLAGRPVHARDVAVTAGAVTIVDRIEGGQRHAVVGRFPLHPDVDKVEQTDGGFRLVMPDRRAVTVAVAGADALAIEQGHYAPEFGICRPRPVLVWRVTRDLPIEVTVEFGV